MHGAWRTGAKQYAEEVRRWGQEIGGLQWAAVQDWMCEDFILKRTGLSLLEHQYRTILSYLELRSIAPDLPWVPVLQGWGAGDYFRHTDQYAAAGIDLTSLPLVGIGSVCRRQSTALAEDVIRSLSSLRIKVHGFGFKILGLRRAARYLASSDSLAWSYSARRNPPLPGCLHKRKMAARLGLVPGEEKSGSCANCIRYALWWREKALLAARPRGEPCLFQLPCNCTD